MESPSVTILLTVRNNESTIKRCIDSILEQDYKNYEIFVVEAFSTDKTYEILLSYGEKIKLFRLEGWAPKAYNWALSKINSKYIALIDGDCEAQSDWLTQLASSFEQGVVGVLGFCKNPQGLPKLQDLLGRELENRFKHFKKFVSRSPTMNFCFETVIANKLLFDEKLKVGYDTDFSFRLTKLGKIKYNSHAVLLHYHRASWKGFFKQQYTTAKTVPKIYLKYPQKSKGDEISKTSMIMQPILMLFFLLSFPLIFIEKYSFILPSSIIIIIFMIYTRDVISLSKDPYESLLYYLIFVVRTFAWTLGLIIGTLQMLILKSNI